MSRTPVRPQSSSGYFNTKSAVPYTAFSPSKQRYDHYAPQRDVIHPNSPPNVVVEPQQNLLLWCWLVILTVISMFLILKTPFSPPVQLENGYQLSQADLETLRQLFQKELTSEWTSIHQKMSHQQIAYDGWTSRTDDVIKVIQADIQQLRQGINIQATSFDSKVDQVNGIVSELKADHRTTADRLHSLQEQLALLQRTDRPSNSSPQHVDASAALEKTLIPIRNEIELLKKEISQISTTQQQQQQQQQQPQQPDAQITSNLTKINASLKDLQASYATLVKSTDGMKSQISDHSLAIQKIQHLNYATKPELTASMEAIQQRYAALAEQLGDISKALAERTISSQDSDIAPQRQKEHQQQLQSLQTDIALQQKRVDEVVQSVQHHATSVRQTQDGVTTTVEDLRRQFVLFQSQVELKIANIISNYNTRPSGTSNDGVVPVPHQTTATAGVLMPMSLTYFTPLAPTSHLSSSRTKTLNLLRPEIALTALTATPTSSNQALIGSSSSAHLLSGEYRMLFPDGIHFSHYEQAYRSPDNRPYAIFHSLLATDVKSADEQAIAPASQGINLQQLLEAQPSLAQYKVVFSIQYPSLSTPVSSSHRLSTTSADSAAAGSILPEALKAVVRRFQIYGIKSSTPPISSKVARVVSSLLLDDNSADILRDAVLLGDFTTDLSRLFPIKSSSGSPEVHQCQLTNPAACKQSFLLSDPHSGALLATKVMQFNYFAIVLDDNYGHPDFTHLGHPSFELVPPSS